VVVRHWWGAAGWALASHLGVSMATKPAKGWHILVIHEGLRNQQVLRHAFARYGAEVPRVRALLECAELSSVEKAPLREMLELVMLRTIHGGGASWRELARALGGLPDIEPPTATYGSKCFA